MYTESKLSSPIYMYQIVTETMYQATNIEIFSISQATSEIVEKSSGLSHILWNISPQVFFDFEVEYAKEWFNSKSQIFKLEIFDTFKKLKISVKVKNRFLEIKFWFSRTRLNRNRNRCWSCIKLIWSQSWPSRKEFSLCWSCLAE